MSNATRPMAVLLDELATEFFGPEWPGPLSQFSGINARTLQRIRKAAAEGRDHAAAHGALAAIAEAVPVFAERLTALAPESK